MNKAADIVDECPRRQGQNIEEPFHKLTIMLVKHCPEPALPSVLKCKTAEKITANEIQELPIKHQKKTRTKFIGKSYHSKQIGAYAQTTKTR